MILLGHSLIQPFKERLGSLEKLSTKRGFKPFFLKKLKDKGYVTFNRTLDENYDIETDPERRLQKFVNSLNSLVEKNVNYKTFEKKCEQNVNTLIRNAKETKLRIIEGITNDRISNSGNAEVYDS